MNKSTGSQAKTKQGTIHIANSQIEKKSVYVRRSSSDPDMLNEIEGIGPGLMVQFKSKLQKVICFRRYVRGYSRLSGRTDLERRHQPRGADK